MTGIDSLEKLVQKYRSKYRIIMSGRPFKIDERHGIHNYPLYLTNRFPIRL